MRKLWPLIQYYYLWQKIIPLLVGFGVFLFLIKLLLSPYNDGGTFFVGMASFIFLFVIPFCSGATALRDLISNQQTILVPGFKQQALLAHLFIAVVASLFLYVNFLIFNPNPTSPLAPLWVFVALSAYSGFMQLVLPSRFFVTIISIFPMVCALIVIQSREVIADLFVNRAFMTGLFLLSVIGWVYSYYLLGSRNQFKPANTALHCTEAWTTYDGGLLSRLALGQSRTAQGTLLLGYPDNWWGIILRVTNYFILTPLFTTSAMVYIGITEDWDMPTLKSAVVLFLMISLYSGVFCIFVHGELVARARLVWLRFGTDRHNQWQLVNNYCLRFLLVYYVCGIISTMLARVLTDLEQLHLLHYLLILFSYCFFNLYFALFMRVCKLPALLMVIVVIITMVAVAFSMMMATANDTSPTYDFLIGAECVLTLLGIAFYKSVRDKFTDIDWQQVKIKRPNTNYVLTEER